MPGPPLLLVTDRRQAVAPLPTILKLAFAAGCRFASIREKDLSNPEQVALAKEIFPLARRFGVSLLLHGDPEIADAAGLAGVHLPAGSDPAIARSILREGALIGISVHGPAEAARLDSGLVDYAVAGPAFETASKPGYGPALGPAGLAAIVAASRVPVLAIGGISAKTIPAVAAAGVAGIAVMGGVMRAADPGAEIRGLLSAWDAAAQPRPR
ncbi:hypothetical protein CH341_22445 [Rhodoplanes roseus]|uniref:Thiamine phosphate synthase/TenI domain-containing protein n=1 Tax=Rhodoplanes roseus TaxID=29409 RepID=A0A327KSW6_9BRAD|nr:hypothetical protein CH341_22445 [Rhodoplanes roseus]